MGAFSFPSKFYRLWVFAQNCLFHAAAARNHIIAVLKTVSLTYNFGIHLKQNTMKSQSITTVIVFLLITTVVSCQKQTALKQQKTAATTSDAYTIGTYLVKRCVPKQISYVNMHGGEWLSPILTETIYPVTGVTYAQTEFVVHDSDENFPGEKASYQFFHIEPEFPAASGYVDLVDENLAGWGHGLFDANGQLTAVSYFNDNIKEEYAAYNLGVFHEFPDLLFHYLPDGRLSTVTRHWPDGSQPDDTQHFTYDTQGNIIKMVTLRNGVTDESQSLLTVTLTYGAPTTKRQFYTWFQGGTYHSDESMAIAEFYGWVRAFTPKNILLRVDRYEPHGHAASHFTDILSDHQFDSEGKLISYTDNRTSIDNRIPHVSFTTKIDWYCEGGLVVTK